MEQNESKRCVNFCELYPRCSAIGNEQLLSSKKMDDHRSYTALICIGLIPLGLADYLIEWGVSDQKSKIHFGYYAFYFWLAIPAYTLWKTNNYLVSVFIILLTLAICSLQSAFILGMDEISFLTIISSIVTTPFLYCLSCLASRFTFRLLH